jgi:peptidoglycan/LPS O-acetylase OafA/YrhL
MWLVGDLVWGVAFFVVVNWSVAREMAWPRGRRLPAWVASLAAIGVFSYSLYLTHEIVEWRLWPLVAAQLAETGHLLPQIVVMILMVAASLAFARAFFVLFERPFLTRRPSSGRSPMAAPIQA